MWEGWDFDKSTQGKLLAFMIWEKRNKGQKRYMDIFYTFLVTQEKKSSHPYLEIPFKLSGTFELSGYQTAYLESALLFQTCFLLENSQKLPQNNDILKFCRFLPHFISNFFENSCFIISYVPFSFFQFPTTFALELYMCMLGCYMIHWII